MIGTVVLAGVFFLVIAGGVAFASRYVKDGPKPAAPPAPKLSPQQQRCADDLARLDAAFTRWAGGAELTRDELEDADAIVRRRFELAAVQSGTRDVQALRLDEQTNLFLVAVRAAAMGHPSHGAWPVASPIRPMVVDELLRRVTLRPSLALHTAMVPAALSVGAFELAVQSLGGLKGHPRLRAEVLGWARDMLVSAPSRNHADPVLRFLRVVGDKFSSQTTLGAAEQHALRFAVLPSPAIDARTTLADPRPPLTCRTLLHTWYDVHDPTSANARLTFFLRVGVRSLVAALVEEGDVPARDAEHARRRALLANDPHGYGQRRGLAFDLVRVIEIARLAHAAGYLSASEGWTWVHAAARELESHYDGFPSIASDYLRGHAFAGGTGHESDLVELVTYLVRAPTSPWARDPRAAA